MPGGARRRRRFLDFVLAERTIFTKIQLLPTVFWMCFCCVLHLSHVTHTIPIINTHTYIHTLTHTLSLTHSHTLFPSLTLSQAPTNRHYHTHIITIIITMSIIIIATHRPSQSPPNTDFHNHRILHLEHQYSTTQQLNNKIVA